MIIPAPASGSDQTSESLIFLQTLVDTIPNPLFHADRDGRFRFCNPAFAELFGHDPSDIIGKTLADLVPSIFTGNTVLDQHPGRHMVPLTLSRKTGELRNVTFHYATLPGPDGQVAGIAGMAIDITEIEKKRVTPFFQQKREALDIVAGSIAHSLNNAMGAIIGNLETALQYEILDACPSRETVTDALNAGMHAKDLILQLITFVRKSHDGIEPLPLSTLIRGTLLTLHLRPITVEYDIAPDLEPLMADVTQMYQLLISLIDHAVRSMGRREGRIQISLKYVHITPEMAGKLKLSGPGRFQALRVVTHTVCPNSEQQKGSNREPEPENAFKFESIDGIVQHHNAAMEIKKISGNGSQVTVFFPSIREAGKR